MRGLAGNDSGAAAAEMALVTPFLFFLMFGSMELGNYFYSEHVVVKAVRDGARFASRQSFDSFTCPDQIDSTVKTNTQNVTRTNRVAPGGTARLKGWTDNATVSVTVQCDTSGSYKSFYEGMAATGGIPVVKVSATVSYSSLFASIGFASIGLSLRAESQAPVMGA